MLKHFVRPNYLTNQNLHTKREQNTFNRSKFHIVRLFMEITQCFLIGIRLCKIVLYEYEEISLRDFETAESFLLQSQLVNTKKKNGIHFPWPLHSSFCRVGRRSSLPPPLIPSPLSPFCWFFSFIIIGRIEHYWRIAVIGNAFEIFKKWLLQTFSASVKLRKTILRFCRLTLMNEWRWRTSKMYFSCVI